MPIRLKTKYVDSFLPEGAMESIIPEVEAAHKSLLSGTGKGNGFLGWLTLPEDYDKAEFEAIKKAAQKIQNNSQVLVVVGIGGSYLGA